MKDLFSLQSKDYAEFRPVYPPGLYDFLFGLVPGFEAAWDVGTGNGQVAVALAERFRRVEATDISERQLAQASAQPNVRYTVAPAERAPFEDATFDLVTAAQAAHWFDRPAFYGEARRVLRPGGVLALWGYGLLRTADPDVDAWMDRFYQEVTGPYWDPERSHIDAAYRSFDFPFDEVETPAFSMSFRWTLERLLGFLGTWSAVQHFRRATGADPVAAEAVRLEKHWPAGEEKAVAFPVFMRVGR